MALGNTHNTNSTGSTPNTSQTPVTFTINSHGHAELGGVDVTELAQIYGTPLYVVDEATVRAMARAYKTAAETHYPAESLPLYASKANLNLGLCRLVEQEGLGLDVVSGGELFTALQAGFSAEKIVFNGNNKSVDELNMALHHKIGRITVDNPHELALIHELCQSGDHKADVLLRITPGIDCHTHDYIKTGKIDSKFGFDMSQLVPALDKLAGQYKDTITLKGLHAHIGSQIFEVAPFEDLAITLLNIYYNIRQRYDGLTLPDLNIGGGLGVAYTNSDDPVDVNAALERVCKKLVAYANKIEYPLPRLLMEPGRSMIATAGVTLYTIGSFKEVPNVRKYVAIDGGMGDNIRPSLYQAEYSALVANKANQPNTETVTVAGKYCESGDILLTNLQVPSLELGDVLMVLGTGAYNYTMASNYNRVPRPAMVLVENGNSHLLVRRETYESLMQYDTIPPHLQAQPAK